MRIHILSLFALSALALGLHYGSQSPQKIALVNKTGYDIQALYVAPSCADDSDDLLKNRKLAPGQAIQVPMPGQHKNWDVYLGWNDDEEDDDELDGLALTPGHTYAVIYDEENDVTSIREI